MKIDLILIGGELIHGKRSDLNGPELARQLRPFGHEINSILTISDQFEMIEEAIKQIRSDAASHPSLPHLLITSGGLGPTGDDLTKMAVARALAVSLQESSEAKKICLENYARHGRQWEPELNNYHLIPEGVEPLNNPTGHAPGLKFRQGNFTLLSLPGVPHEFSSILTQEMKKGLVQLSSARQFYTVKTREIAEEQIFKKLCPTLWQELEHFGPVSSLPHAGGVEISVDTDPENFLALDKLFKNSLLLPYIWQFGDLPIHHFVLQQLGRWQKSLSVAESCSGGLCSHLLTEIPGSSEQFKGAVVCYSNQVKMGLLGVSQKTIEKHSEVSHQAAKELALGVRKKMETSIGLSFTGFAGPSGGTNADPVGTVYIGISSTLGEKSFRYTFHGSRQSLKQKFVQYGFYRLLDELKELSSATDASSL